MAVYFNGVSKLRSNLASQHCMKQKKPWESKIKETRMNTREKKHCILIIGDLTPLDSIKNMKYTRAACVASQRSRETRIQRKDKGLLTS